MKLRCRKKISTSLLLLAGLLSQQVNAQKTIVQYLSGTDKDHTVNWDFYCSGGRNSGKWTTIPVPSNWDMQGFGTYAYRKDNDEPETGMYKYVFKVDDAYKNKQINIVFEAAMTDAAVSINGQSAGPVHQGGFYEFKYDITKLLKFGVNNTLEVTVKKHSANASVNHAERKADFWLFAGIYRPVYLEILPSTFINRVAIDAKAGGEFKVQVLTKNTRSNQDITVQIEDLKGKTIGKSFTAKAMDSLVLKQSFTNIKNWNPEQPELYNAIFSIKEKGRTLHTIKQRFGFRTAELRKNDGFYVNDVKVIFKGVNRHSQWPESGRTLSREIHLMDIALVKEMNMNAVRMSHYPPDKEFLDLCDSIGLFVIDELTGWQGAYDTITGQKLVKELVVRDVNHPSVVMWANGNEGGFNRGIDNDYALYDPQHRQVIHPWEKFNGTNTKHYPDFSYVQNEVKNGKDVFFPTEFMHGLFDGGHGAGLEDFWNEMMKQPTAGGGFLWALHDEGVVRTDQNNTIDVAGNQAPDGIVGPHREKEGSFYTIKELWSPVKLDAVRFGKSTVSFTLENQYLYTNLNACTIRWKWLQLPLPQDTAGQSKILESGLLPKLSVVPKQKQAFDININNNVTKADALDISVYDANGNLVINWVLRNTTTDKVLAKINAGTKESKDITTTNSGEFLKVSCDDITYFFNQKNGLLHHVNNGTTDISLAEGPVPAGLQLTLRQLKSYRDGNDFIVEPLYDTSNHFTAKWRFKKGNFPQLDYSYHTDSIASYRGVTFQYPEEKIKGMRYQGQGPYRVWKNRLAGTAFGVWQKNYNNTITGESWNYPEFKGWHAGVDWVTIQNSESNFTIYATEGRYLQMLKPARPKASPNNNTDPPFPGNTIGFFSAISPIGTKFQDAVKLGPQSQKNEALPATSGPFKGSLYFDFRPTK